MEWNVCAHGDCRDILSRLDAGLFQCCVTSPPYWGLRDYGDKQQIGLEGTPEEYAAMLVDVFRYVRRVLRDDGIVWLNVGDSYTGSPNSGSGGGKQDTNNPIAGLKSKCGPAKNLVGIPWRVAFALQADGWNLRADVIWHKPAPMPENVSDRPTQAHEHVFLLSKQPRYFYDWEAIATKPKGKPTRVGASGRDRYQHSPGGMPGRQLVNARNVWTIGHHGEKRHPAAMALELAERCIKTGTHIGDAVLDPFFGSGTTARAAVALDRRWFGCELNADYRCLYRPPAQLRLFVDQKNR